MRMRLRSCICVICKPANFRAAVSKSRQETVNRAFHMHASLSEDCSAPVTKKNSTGSSWRSDGHRPETCRIHTPQIGLKLYDPCSYKILRSYFVKLFKWNETKLRDLVLKRKLRKAKSLQYKLKTFEGNKTIFQKGLVAEERLCEIHFGLKREVKSCSLFLTLVAESGCKTISTVQAQAGSPPLLISFVSKKKILIISVLHWAPLLYFLMA